MVIYHCTPCKAFTFVRSTLSLVQVIRLFPQYPESSAPKSEESGVVKQFVIRPVFYEVT